MKLTKPLVALDLETTGLYPKRDRIVQIGVVKLFPDGHEIEWETLVNPQMRIPKDATDTHGITDEIVAEEPPFEMIAAGFQQALRGADICGYNVAFDLRFLKEEYLRLKRGFEHGKVVDPYKIRQKFEKRTLSDSYEHYCGEKLEGAHTALADARASLRILQAQVERYPDLPQDVDGLHNFLWNTAEDGYADSDRKIALRNGEPILNFGKHSGLPLSEIPGEYLEWILKGNFSDKVKEVVKEVLDGRR